MAMMSNDTDMFVGEILENLTDDDLMTATLCFLQNVYNYNSVVKQSKRINVLDIFMPYVNVDQDEFGGVDLSRLGTAELEDIMTSTYMAYSEALYGLKCDPFLPLIVDKDNFIQIIEHTA